MRKWQAISALGGLVGTLVSWRHKPSICRMSFKHFTPDFRMSDSPRF